MATSNQMPAEGTQYEVRWNRRSFRRNVLLIVVVWVAYVAIAVFASGILEKIGIAGAIVFGLVGVGGGIGGEIYIRLSPVAATLTPSGVSIRRHDPVAWGNIREVRLGALKPRSLFAFRPLHYIAFLPTRTEDLPRLSPRERLAVKLYGTSLLLLTENMNPPAEEILDAVGRLSDVPIRVVE